MKTKLSDLPQCGSFALVTYIPDPFRSLLESLRRDLPGKKTPQAHITILPPRPLQIPVEKASLEARRILSGFAPFGVKLSTVSVFAETNTLYLNITDGNDALHKLHDALNVGSLTHKEDFQFQPHLTIGGPIPSEVLAEVHAHAVRAWGKRRTKIVFEVSEVVALCQPLNGSSNDWIRVWSQKLGDTGNTAHAGA
jgi:2'-5' RNA ligase